MTDGFQAYRHYIRLKLHFSKKDNYNIFENKGVRASLSSFEKRNDRYKFASIEKMRDYKYYILANIIDDVDKYIREFSEEPYVRFKRVMNSLTYIYKEFIKHNDFISLATLKNSRVELIDMLKRGEVDIEIICILNMIFNFTDEWEKDKIFSFVYEKEIFVIKKYSDFFTEYAEKMREFTINNCDHTDQLRLSKVN